MNFRIRPDYSIILMSVSRNAPYRDEVLDDGSTIIYEGHDIPNLRGGPDPKSADQPETLPSGKLTENGKFLRAALAAKRGTAPPERVRVYEKIKAGIWSDNGIFNLVDGWQESDGHRLVYRFRLEAVSDDLSSYPDKVAEAPELQHSRVIPTHIKLEVWKRDQGKCVQCGSTKNLHFDHIIPYSKGGTSLRAENIQLLCARHNIEKKDSII